MKKLKVVGVIICTLIISVCASASFFCLTGCSGGFKLVQKVEFVSNGKSYKFSSSWSTFYSFIAYITKDEYNEISMKKPLLIVQASGTVVWSIAKEHKGEYKFTLPTTKLSDATLKKYGMSEDDLVRYHLDGYSMASYTYVKGRLSSTTNYSLLYVKKVNNTTLKIKKGSDTEETYTVTSFTITKY